MTWNVFVVIAVGYMNVILINDLLDSLLVHVVVVDSHVVLVVASSPVGYGAETKDIVGQRTDYIHDFFQRRL